MSLRGSLAAGRCVRRHGVGPPAFAQPRETRMLITVIDQTNAVIPDATVTVTGHRAGDPESGAAAGQDDAERPGDDRRPDAGPLHGARGVSRVSIPAY